MDTKFRLTFLAAAALMLAGFVSAANGTMPGSGTSEDPFIVQDCFDLQAIPSTSYKNYSLEGPIDCSETSSWNSGAGFNPIINFYGTFDGKGYEISGLYINRGDFVGLFHHLQTGAVVRDVGLVGIDITGKDYVGGLVGYNHEGIITCCYTKGQVTGRDYVGGLVGYNAGGDRGNITKSFSNVTVQGDVYVGGLAGRVQSNPYKYIGVRYSFALGDVSGNTNVGGLVGHIPTHSGISDSFARGNVSGTSNVGGLLGLYACRPGGDEWISRTYAITSHNLVGATEYYFSLNDCEGSSLLSIAGDGLEMLERATYGSGFFASGDWDMDEAEGTVNDGYPYLRWGLPSATIDSPAENPKTIEVGESVDFQGSLNPASCAMFIEEYRWECSPVGGTCPSTFPILNVEDPGIVVFNAGGTYDISFKVTTPYGSGLGDLVRVIVQQAAVSISPILDPGLIEQGSNFNDAKLDVANSGSAIDADIFVAVLDAVSHTEVRPENKIRSAITVASGSAVPIDLKAWLDAPSLAQGNYRLEAVAKEAGTENVLDQASESFTVGPARRPLPVPELDLLVLPLLLSIVLLVLWAKK